MDKWKNYVELSDIFETYEEGVSDFDEHKDLIVQRLLHSSNKFVLISKYDRENLKDLIDELAGTEDLSEFNDCLDLIYDWGDVDHKLWINTMGVLKDGLVL